MVARAGGGLGLSRKLPLILGKGSPPWLHAPSTEPCGRQAEEAAASCQASTASAPWNNNHIPIRRVFEPYHLLPFITLALPPGSSVADTRAYVAALGAEIEQALMRIYVGSVSYWEVNTVKRTVAMSGPSGMSSMNEILI